MTVVGHCTFEILFPKILDFFNMWVFVRTSTNFAHLTSFQVIEFMDWPILKTLDISVCQKSENKAFKMQHSATVVCPLFAAKIISSLVSMFSARTPSTMTTITTWEEMFGESSGKLGLKMTNKTHTDERKMVQLSYLVPA